MTIFKSRQVNTDPAPWRNPNDGERRSHGVKWISGPDVLDPRPEFNVTRDRKPWVNAVGVRVRHEWNAPDHQPFHWKPRPEFDHPVNRILAGVRDDMAGSTDMNGDAKATAEYWLSFSDDWDKDGLTATPAEIDHARRVLTRLANMKESSNG